MAETSNDHTTTAVIGSRLARVEVCLSGGAAVVVAVFLALFAASLVNLREAQTLRAENATQVQESLAKISAAVETNARSAETNAKAIALLTKISEENSKALRGR